MINKLKKRDLANLLNRAAAALETPDDLNELEVSELIEDLVVEARAYEED